MHTEQLAGVKNLKKLYQINGVATGFVHVSITLAPYYFLCD